MAFKIEFSDPINRVQSQYEGRLKSNAHTTVEGERKEIPEWDEKYENKTI